MICASTAARLTLRTKQMSGGNLLNTVAFSTRIQLSELPNFDAKIIKPNITQKIYGDSGNME